MLQSSDKIPANDFQNQARNWLRLFTAVYQTKHITPYVHLLTSHNADFPEIHGTIALFSQQGLEKLNDDIAKYYSRSTNHHDEVSFFYRLKELEDHLKLSHVCRVCKQIGHNIRKNMQT